MWDGLAGWVRVLCGLFAASPLAGCKDAEDARVAPGPAAGAGGADRGEAGAATDAAGQASVEPGAAGRAGAPGALGGAATGGAPAVECVDVYPYDDGYTCEQQAAWGKCDEVWLVGYCRVSCGTCDVEPRGEGGSQGGEREIFAEYAPKEPLAPTPPMGWNSWNRFATSIDEELVRQIADAMVASGMRDAGYQYVNIDDGWQAPERDADGRIVPDPERFPGGMAALAEYVHGLDLKLGLYSDRGDYTCGGYPGSYGHEVEDAQTYAAWGIDYLKYDNCHIPPGRDDDPEMQEDYAIMGEALRRAGRPIVYSLCAWWFRPWMPEVGHLWRTTTDIRDEWSGTSHSVIALLNRNGGDTERYGAFSEDAFDTGAYAAPGLARYAGPHGWNDPDMLEVGNGGMTDVEYRAHFSLWALMAAPLIAGNDLRDMDLATVEILTNREVIAINQDPLGIQGTPISASTTLEVWHKRLSGADTHAVVLFNRTEAAADITVTWEELGLVATSALVRDLWLGEDVGVLAEGYTASVPAHGVVMVKVTGQ